MALKCNFCGGRLYYNIGEKNLTCESCCSTFEVNVYSANNNAEIGSDYSEGYKMDTYVCRNCGAQLSAPEEQVVAYCAYCGSEALELTKVTKGNEPTGIVPFEIGIEEVKEKYRKAIGNSVCVPDELLSDEHLSEFRGIYIPYWSTGINVSSNPFRLKGAKDYYKSGYDYHEEYDIDVSVNGEVDGGFYDASIAFDDTVAAEIAPFKNKPEPFHEGYLAGFYADTVTADRQKYEKVALETAIDNVSKKISSRVHGAEFNKKTIRKHLETEGSQNSSITLFPVWFLTWKKGKRVAYSVMNGQTGALTVDLPVDYKKFFKLVLIQAIIYFAFLSIFPVFQLPLHVAAATSITCYVSMLIMNAELREIRLREQHVFDIGYEGKSIWKKIPYVKEKKGCLLALKGFFYFFVFCMFLFCFSFETPEEVKQSIFVFMLLQIIPAVRGIINTLGISNKIGIVTIAFSMAAQIVGFLLAGKYHPEDYWYYIIGLLLIAGMLANILTAIFYTNYLTTRPVPNFFSREGGRNAE